jgi:hypothetical protein
VSCNALPDQENATRKNNKEFMRKIFLFTVERNLNRIANLIEEIKEILLKKEKHEARNNGKKD